MSDSACCVLGRGNHGYRQDIDGLRAIAILSVVVFHAFPDLLRGGFVGVDVFFVISGFLISSIIFKGLQKGDFSFSSFYLSRVRRIFPALVVVLLASYVFGWFVLLPDEFKQLGKHVSSGSAFLQNIVLWNESGYFDVASESKPLMHLWSLAVEEQFYIFYPLIMWGAWRLGLSIFLVVTVLAGASFYSSVSGVLEDPVKYFFVPHARFWELLAGALLGCISVAGAGRFGGVLQLARFFGATTPLGRIIGSRGVANILSIFGLILLLISFVKIHKGMLFPGWWAVFPVLGAACLVSAGPNALVNRVVLSNPLMVFVGLISYPLYLWHWPLLSFFRIIESGVPPWEVRAGLVVLSVLLAWLTYRYVERPIRFGGFPERKAVAAVAALVSVGLAGYVSFVREGIPSRYGDDKLPVIKVFSKPYPDVSATDCRDVLPQAKWSNGDLWCMVSKKRPPSIALVGDSHAGQYYHALWNQLDSQSVMAITASSCLPFSAKFLTGECKKKYERVISLLESLDDVDQVYLSGYWAYLMSGGFEREGDGWRMPLPLGKEDAELFKKNARYFISRLLSSGKVITLFKDIPDLDFNVRSCYQLRKIDLSSISPVRKNCYLSFGEYSDRVAVYDKVLDELLAEFPSIQVYDPKGLLCKGGVCRAADEYLPYYYNGDHLNYYGASIVVRDLLGRQQTE